MFTTNIAATAILFRRHRNCRRKSIKRSKKAIGTKS
jgi:hypothetical protein